jgi:hypothetical protein
MFYVLETIPQELLKIFKYERDPRGGLQCEKT